MTTGYNGRYVKKTEVISINGNHTPSIGNFPKLLDSAVAVFINDLILVCGGYPFTNECYSISKGETTFKYFASMQEKRARARGTVIDGKFWITGGCNESTVFDSTEFVTPQNLSKPIEKIILPSSLWSHAIINLNETTSLLIGGKAEAGLDIWKMTYYYNHIKKIWSVGPRLIYSRRGHTAGTIKDHVTQKEHIAVVSGIGHASRSVELLFNGKKNWELGMYVATYFLFFGNVYISFK